MLAMRSMPQALLEKVINFEKRLVIKLWMTYIIISTCLHCACLVWYESFIQLHKSYSYLLMQPLDGVSETNKQKKDIGWGLADHPGYFTVWLPIFHDLLLATDKSNWFLPTRKSNWLLPKTIKFACHQQASWFSCWMKSDQSWNRVREKLEKS